MEYTITPRQPGVRPADPPDYDGITFVYVFTYVLDPWTQPGVNQNVTLVVANAQGFIPGMTVMIEGGGYYEVVSTTALDRMTVLNLGYSSNPPPGTGIIPGKITTTSLPGPPGDPGPSGPPGESGTVLNMKGTVPTSADLPTTGNELNDTYTALDTGHAWTFNGTTWVDIGPIQGPPGADSTVPGPPGPAGPASTVPGPAGIPAYTITSGSVTIPAVGATVVVTVADASWIAVGEMVYMDQAGGGPGKAGALQVVAKTGDQLTLLNPVPPTAATSPSLQMIWGETPSGVVNGINKNYTSVNPYSPNLLTVFLNGLRQRRTDDYTETGSNSFSFVSAPLSGDSLSIDYVMS